MALEDELESELAKDMIKGQEVVSQSAKGRGVQETQGPTGYAPRALRIKGERVGELELAGAKKKYDEYVDQYMNTAQFRDESHAQTKRMEMNRNFNNFQMDMMKKAMKYKSQLDKANLNEQERQASIAAYTKMVTGATSLAIGYGKSKDDSGDKKYEAIDASDPSKFGSTV